MNLPTKFEEILKNDQQLYGAVHLTLSTFETWLKQNYLPFFPEYTDHSERHVEEVLTATQALIRDEAWDVINPEDIAVLSLAVLVHDAGMHLSEDGFIKLVSADSSWTTPHNVGEPTWTQLWSDFLGEASRFDARKLKQLFGNDKPVRRRPSDTREMTKHEDDRLLIGEFLRRHHPRLAREIAISGVPGPNNTFYSFQNVPKHIARLAGQVAHSHGVSIRDAVEWLERDQQREMYGAHIPFLMALLRIADYLQIQKERAPKDLLLIRSLRSPISLGEWKAHYAVKYVNNTHDDSESIYVYAEPKDVQTFLKLRNLFAGIQRELDTSWATLGEVYSGLRHEVSVLGLNGLVIRRIRSNLDKIHEFRETVPYIPEKVSLQTANAELVNLLIEPLYGANPEIGVRELLQNAVDACRELDDYLKQNSNIEPDFPEQEEDVKVELYTDEQEKKWFRIRDKGMGMTVSTVKNFFLTAGASFRASDAWKKQHVTDSGQSRVLRSGRFGIGALAAFLIGDKVHVTTRHISQPASSAISFTFRVDDDAIELQRTTAEVGTTIEIVVDDDKWEKLIEDKNVNIDYLHRTSYPTRAIWQWYYLKYPSIAISVEGKRFPHPAYFPAESDELSPYWRSLSHPDYEAVHWSVKPYERTHWSHKGILTCNGIFITEGLPAILGDGSQMFTLHTPKISIFDSGGNIPVNLQRTELHFLPFREELQREMIRDTIGYLLVQGPNNIFASPPRYPMLDRQKALIPWILYTQKGFFLADRWLIIHLGFEKVISTTYSSVSLRRRVHSLSGTETLFAPATVDKSAYKTWLEQSLTRFDYEFYRDEERGFVLGTRTLMSANRYGDLQTPRKYRKELREKFKGAEENNDWVLLESGLVQEESFNFGRITQQPPYSDEMAIAEMYLDREEWLEKESSLVGDIWKEVIGDVAIPYKVEERKRLLPHSFEILDEYIQKHQALAKERKA